MKTFRLNAVFVQKQIMKRAIKYFWQFAKSCLHLNETNTKRSCLLFQKKRD